jgi:hypothetical protein
MRPGGFLTAWRCRRNALSLSKSPTFRGLSAGMATIRDEMGHCGVEAFRDSVSRGSASVPQELTAAASGPGALRSQAVGDRERTSPSAPARQRATRRSDGLRSQALRPSPVTESVRRERQRVREINAKANSSLPPRWRGPDGQWPGLSRIVAIPHLHRWHPGETRRLKFLQTRLLQMPPVPLILTSDAGSTGADRKPGGMTS